MEIDRFLEDLRAYFADRSESILIHLDTPEDKVSIGLPFSEAGCTGPTQELYLIHEGGQQSDATSNAIALLPVTLENLPLFADTKLRAWTGTEVQSSPEELQAEIDRRQRELGGFGRGLLVLVNDRAAGFIWWHDDPTRVRWISQVATRLPFRKLGVATAMLNACLETASASGMIAVVINVDPANQAAFGLYRRLGFSDHVYAVDTYALQAKRLSA